MTIIEIEQSIKRASAQWQTFRIACAAHVAGCQCPECTFTSSERAWFRSPVGAL